MTSLHESGTASCTISVLKPPPQAIDSPHAWNPPSRSCARCREPASERQLPRIVYKKEVLRSLGCSSATLWRWMQAGKFPKGFTVGGRRGWLAAEVAEWILGHQSG
jgi:prophage regulatory protein